MGNDKTKIEKISSQNINNNMLENNLINDGFQPFKIEKNKFHEQRPARFATIFQWDGDGNNVYLTGSFCDWHQFFEMEKYVDENEKNNKNKKFFLTLFLPKGVYQYKFKIDDQWKCNSNFPTCNDKNGNINNIIDLTKPKGEEGTEFSTSYVTTIPEQKMDETKISNNTRTLENEYYNDNNQIKSEVNNTTQNSSIEYNFKYDFELDILSSQKNIGFNQFLEGKEYNILNDNYSYKKLLPLHNEQVEHFIFNKNSCINSNKPIITSSSFRYGFKLTTIIYYKPKINHEKMK